MILWVIQQPMLEGWDYNLLSILIQDVDISTSSVGVVCEHMHVVLLALPRSSSQLLQNVRYKIRPDADNERK